jgi:hypothetical protein
MRISVDGGVTWGDAMHVVAEVKADHEFVNADLTDSVLTITGVVPVACIVDNTGDVVEVLNINYATDTTISLVEHAPITGTWRVRFAQGGTTGPQGIPGATPALTIGTVTSGTPAAATITGTDLNPVLNLTIPAGETGATPDITVEVETGEAGTDASVEVTGTPEEPVITFTIPRGADGADGGGGGMWTLVERWVPAEAASTKTFSDLNGDVDFRYKIVMRALGAVASYFFININSDTADNYHNRFVGIDSGGLSTGYTSGVSICGSNGIICNYHDANTTAFMLGEIDASSGATRSATLKWHRNTSGAVVLQDIAGFWTNTSSNITSLTVTAQNTNGFGVGSYIELWKLAQ